MLWYWKYFRISGQKLPHKEQIYFLKCMIESSTISMKYWSGSILRPKMSRFSSPHMKSVALNILCRSYALEAFMEGLSAGKKPKDLQASRYRPSWLWVSRSLLSRIEDYAHSCRVHNTGNEAGSQLAWWSRLARIWSLLVRSAMKIYCYRYSRADHIDWQRLLHDLHDNLWP